MQKHILLFFFCATVISSTSMLHCCFDPIILSISSSSLYRIECMWHCTDFEHWNTSGAWAPKQTEHKEVRIEFHLFFSKTFQLDQWNKWAFAKPRLGGNDAWQTSRTWPDAAAKPGTRTSPTPVRQRPLHAAASTDAQPIRSSGATADRAAT